MSVVLTAQTTGAPSTQKDTDSFCHSVPAPPTTVVLVKQPQDTYRVDQPEEEVHVQDVDSADPVVVPVLHSTKRRGEYIKFNVSCNGCSVVVNEIRGDTLMIPQRDASQVHQYGMWQVLVSLPSSPPRLSCRTRTGSDLCA
jgi:hypothetical protein